MTYEFDGRTHRIGEAELQAMERAGMPHRVQDYAMGMHGTAHPGIGGLGTAVQRMRSRVGATAPGMFPVESMARSSVNVLIATTSKLIHLKHYYCCFAPNGRLEVGNAAFASIDRTPPRKGVRSLFG
jgi:hypothetical protein